MGRMLVILCLATLFLGACASTGKKVSSGQDPWYADLDPTNREITSDWDIFDIGPDTFSRGNPMWDDIKYDLDGLLR